MSAFTIGQQVMCIRTYKRRGGSINRPKLCQIYTVRAYCSCADIPAILLVEITNRDVTFARTLLRGEASFAEYFFAPLERLTEASDLEAVA